MRAFAPLLAFLISSTTALAETPCGGEFTSFVKTLKSEAESRGFDAATVDGFFAPVRRDPAVLRADNAQGMFQRPFIEFSRQLISADRITRGKRNADRYDSTFDRVEQEFGVSRGVLLAFWAFETDFGAVQGDFNTANALVTLAHDCRRPELFRPQVFAALELYRQGQFDPARTSGAWAGEIGMVQMLPGDIIENGVDGDGDERADLWRSETDALTSAAHFLNRLGCAGRPLPSDVRRTG